MEMNTYDLKGNTLINGNQIHLVKALQKWNDEILTIREKEFEWQDYQFSPKLTIEQKNERYILKELGFQGLLNDDNLDIYRMIMKLPYNTEFTITKNDIDSIWTRQWHYDNQMLRVEFKKDFKNLNYITLVNSQVLLFMLKNPECELLVRKKHKYFHLLSRQYESEIETERENIERDNSSSNEILPF
tara:strand:- start:27065 stop:27625 length:561 start_codon:yes stop_codon:yes gene_type:complete